MLVNKLINEEGVKHLTCQAYYTYRKSLDDAGKLPPFDSLPDKEQQAWMQAIDRVVELLIRVP